MPGMPIELQPRQKSSFRQKLSLALKRRLSIPEHLKRQPLMDAQFRGDLGLMSSRLYRPDFASEIPQGSASSLRKTAKTARRAALASNFLYPLSCSLFLVGTPLALLYSPAAGVLLLLLAAASLDIATRLNVMGRAACKLAIEKALQLPMGKELVSKFRIRAAKAATEGTQSLADSIGDS